MARAADNVHAWGMDSPRIVGGKKERPKPLNVSCN